MPSKKKGQKKINKLLKHAFQKARKTSKRDGRKKKGLSLDAARALKEDLKRIIL